MGVDTDPDVRGFELIALGACQTLLDKLDPDDLDELELIDRLHEVCEAIASDLNRTAS